MMTIKKIFFFLIISCTVNSPLAYGMVRVQKLKIEYDNLKQDPVANEQAIRALFATAQTFEQGKAWAQEEVKNFQIRLDDAKKKRGAAPSLTRPPSAVRPPAQPPAKKPIPEAVGVPTTGAARRAPIWKFPEDSERGKVWHTLQGAMARYKNSIVPYGQTIWDLWSKSDWDARQTIIPSGDAGTIWEIDPGLGDFLLAYMDQYTYVLSAADRAALVDVVGAIIPSLFGHGAPINKSEMDQLMVKLAKVAGPLAQTLSSKVAERYAPQPGVIEPLPKVPQAPKPKPGIVPEPKPRPMPVKKPTEPEEKEKKEKSVAAALYVSKAYPTFNSWKKAVDALPYLVHSGLTPATIKNYMQLSPIYEGVQKPADLTVEEFDGVLTQFFGVMGNDAIKNPQNWINARITNWQERAVPAADAQPMAPDPEFFNPAAEIERESFVQKLVVPVGARIVLHGDLHADAHSLVEAMAPYMGSSGFKLKENVYIMFLGDYVDRGLYGFECIYTLMRLKIDNPDRVFMTRGNHEDIIISARFGFATELKNKGVSGLRDKIYNLYDLLPTALYLGSGSNYVQLCHGGLELGFLANDLINSSGSQKFQWLNVLDRQKVADQLTDTYKKQLAVSNNIIPTPGATATGWVDGRQRPIFLGHCWCDFETNMNSKNISISSRGWLLDYGITQELLALNSTGVNKLQGVIRAHQHANEWLSMMELILDRYNRDPENKGVAKLWKADTQKGSTLWKGIVVTLNVSPDMLYGLPSGMWPGFDFDTTCELTTAQNFEQWALKVVRKKITNLPAKPPIEG